MAAVVAVVVGDEDGVDVGDAGRRTRRELGEAPIDLGLR